MGPCRHYLTRFASGAMPEEILSTRGTDGCLFASFCRDAASGFTISWTVFHTEECQCQTCRGWSFSPRCMSSVEMPHQRPCNASERMACPSSKTWQRRQVVPASSCRFPELRGFITSVKYQHVAEAQLLRVDRATLYQSMRQLLEYLAQYTFRKYGTSSAAGTLHELLQSRTAAAASLQF